MDWSADTITRLSRGGAVLVHLKCFEDEFFAESETGVDLRDFNLFAIRV
jgi:hypothetical protein